MPVKFNVTPLGDEFETVEYVAREVKGKGENPEIEAAGERLWATLEPAIEAFRTEVLRVLGPAFAVEFAFDVEVVNLEELKAGMLVPSPFFLRDESWFN